MLRFRPGWLISLVCIMAFMLLICVCKILIEAKLMRRSAMMRRVHSVSNESGSRHRNSQHAPQVDGPDGVYTSRSKEIRKAKFYISKTLFKLKIFNLKFQVIVLFRASSRSLRANCFNKRRLHRPITHLSCPNTTWAQEILIII